MAAKYTEHQLSGMAVNPETKGRLVETYPHLGKMLHDADLTLGENEDVLIRYLAYTLDPASPMAKEFPEPRSRNEAAAKITGYKQSDKHTPFKILFLQQVVRSLDYRVLLAMEHLFKECEELMYDDIKKGNDVKDTDIIAAQQKKSALMDKMSELADKMPIRREKLYAGDKDLEKAANSKAYQTAEAVGHRIKK